jgi:lysozyme
MPYFRNEETMNDDRKLTQDGIDLIQHFEGCLQPHQGKVKAYRCPANCLTIGWGHTNHHGRQFGEHDVWTKEECDQVFLEDMAGFEADVRRLVNKVALTPWQFDSLVSFTSNVGAGNLAKSTLLKHVNSKNFTAAQQEFQKWNKANGKVMKGLTRRRNSEALMFGGTPDYNFDGVKNDPMPQLVDEPEKEGG